VYIFDTGDIPKAGEARRLLCLTPNWDLPRGLAGRWQPEALCSLPLPAECQSWQGVGVWIVPAEKMKLYDWVAERGSPGLLFHLWVTERPNPD
jgi:hypothetical protein